MTLLFAHPVTGWTIAEDAAKAGIVADTGYDPSGGRHGDGAFLCIDSTTSVVKSFTEAGSEALIQFSVKFTELGFETILLEVRNNAGADVCLTLRVTAQGAVVVYDADGLEVGRTAVGTIGWNTWHSICIDAEIGSSSGLVRLFVNGGTTALVQDVGINLSAGDAGGADQAKWTISEGGSRAWALCQLLMYDTVSGATGDQMVSHIPDPRLYPLLPAGDSTAEWTRSTGSVNSELVDDPLGAVSDEDGTYVLATAAEKEDLYDFGDLPPDVEDVFGVVIDIEHRNDGGLPADSELTTQIQSDSEILQGLGGDVSSSGTYVEHQNFYPRADSSTDWDRATVNALRAGPFLRTADG